MTTMNIHDVIKVEQTATKRTDYINSEGKPAYYYSSDIAIHTLDDGVLGITLFFAKPKD